jgi:hypothetical protein
VRHGLPDLAVPPDRLALTGWEGEVDAHVAWTRRTSHRLVDVKRRLDPDNVFHLNQDIDLS